MALRWLAPHTAAPVSSPPRGNTTHARPESIVVAHLDQPFKGEVRDSPEQPDAGLASGPSKTSARDPSTSWDTSSMGSSGSVTATTAARSESRQKRQPPEQRLLAFGQEVVAHAMVSRIFRCEQDCRRRSVAGGGWTKPVEYRLGGEPSAGPSRATRSAGRRGVDRCPRPPQRSHA